MARRPASLGEGARITDFISLGVVTNTFPAKAIQAALKAKFSPTKLSGQPVKVSGVINYKFALVP